MGYQVTVISIKTGAVVAEGITDESGECHFELVSFHYTSQSVDYEGSYHFIATSPDGKLSRRVRGEIQGPTLIIIAIPDHWMPLFVSIIVPIDDSNLVMDKDNRFLETFGYVFTEDENVVASVFFHLYPCLLYTSPSPRDRS